MIGEMGHQPVRRDISGHRHQEQLLSQHPVGELLQALRKGTVIANLLV
jgi:hypothetical protein